MLGTTRMVQPGVLGALPRGRTAKSSEGVRDSSPGQKGQRVPADLVTGAGAKSEGRRARSVEMMTQRPTTGSLRSSGTRDVHLFLRPRLAREEPGQRVGHRHALEEHRGYRGADRHRHAGLAGEA